MKDQIGVFQIYDDMGLETGEAYVAHRVVLFEPESIDEVGLKIARLAGKQRQLKKMKKDMNRQLSIADDRTKKAVEDGFNGYYNARFAASRIVYLGKIGRELYKNSVELKELNEKISKLKTRRNLQSARVRSKGKHEDYSNFVSNLF